VESDGAISSQKLLLSLNTLLSSASSPLVLNDLEALYKITEIVPSGPEASVNFEQFLKQISSLFANALSGSDGSEDGGPLDILVAHRDLFNRIDADRDGRLYPDQLHELVRGLTRMESAGISRSPDVTSTEMIVNHLDKAKKGYVDYVDFLAGALLSTDVPASASSVESKGDDDSVFMSAMGPSGSQHSSVFEDDLEMDYKPSPVRAGSSVESASLTQMKSQAHMLEQRLSAAQSELDKSELARADLLARLNEQDKQIDGYKKQLKAVSDLEQDRHRISNEMEQLRADLHTAKESLKTAAKLELELTAERDRLRDDLFQKGKELNDTSDALRGLRESAAGAEDAKNQLAALQAQLAAQQEKYDALAKAKADSDAAHAKMAEALHELQAKHEVALLEVEEAKRQYLDLSDEKNALSTSQAPRQKGSNLKAELTSVMRPMSPSKHSDTLVTSLPSSSSTGLASTGSSSALAIPGADTSNSANEVIQLKIELEMLAKEKKALLAHLSAAEAKSGTFEREKDELTGKVTALSSDLTASERSKASLQRQFDDAKAELEDMKEMIKVSQDAVGAANAAAAKAAASQFARPEATMTETELEELRVLRLSRREMEEQIGKLKAQVDSDAFQIRALKNEVQQLRDLNRSLKTRIAQIPEETIPLSADDDLRRGLIGNSRVARHDRGCCDSCTIS
jgi:hypothetical protein